MSALTSLDDHDDRATDDRSATDAGRPSLVSPAQRHFFDTFGFLRLPGLFADDVTRMTEGFEEVFAAAEGRTFDTRVALHFDKLRSIIPQFITQSDKLRWLADDPRTTAIVSALMDCPFEYAESDGNIFSCDTSWHADMYGAPLTQSHLKLSFYLDPLHGQSGAIRMIPGTNHWQTPYAQAIREAIAEPSMIDPSLGIEPSELPSWTLESEPGDVIVWDFRTVHGSFGGGERRRLFSMNFRQQLADDDVEGLAERARAEAVAAAVILQISGADQLDTPAPRATTDAGA